MKKLMCSSFKFNEATMSVTESAAFIPEVWANRALGHLRKMCVFVSQCRRDFDEKISSQGKTVNIPKRGTLVANDKDPSTGVTLQNPTASTVAVTLTDHKEVSFLVEDIAEAQADMTILDGYVEDASRVLAEAADLSIANLYSTVAVGKTIYMGSDSLAASHILSARTKIVTDGPYPGTAPRALIIRDMAEMLSVDDFISRERMPDANNLADGVVGRVAGFSVFENQNVPVVAEETQRLAFPQEAIAFVSRRLPSPPQNTGVSAATVVADNIALRVLYGYNMTHLAMQVTLDTLFGSKIVRDELVALITEGQEPI